MPIAESQATLNNAQSIIAIQIALAGEDLLGVSSYTRSSIC
jgi:hypothetical protein